MRQKNLVLAVALFTLGRGAGAPSEALTVNYLIEQFRLAGLQPGNPDGT